MAILKKKRLRIGCHPKSSSPALNHIIFDRMLMWNCKSTPFKKMYEIHIQIHSSIEDCIHVCVYIYTLYIFLDLSDHFHLPWGDVWQWYCWWFRNPTTPGKETKPVINSEIKLPASNRNVWIISNKVPLFGLNTLGGHKYVPSKIPHGLNTLLETNRHIPRMEEEKSLGPSYL